MNRLLKSLVLIVSIFCAATLFAQKDNVRKNLLFNFDWKFKMGDINNAQKPTFNDSNWQKLDLPHDFQIERPWDMHASRARAFKTMGVGWYRKEFKADSGWIGKKILIDFEGIMLSGEVWLNGEKIGETGYGYLGFAADISNKMRYDSVNTVAVRASTGDASDSRWYTGGGIFRDVHLIIKDIISVARHGVYISTPEVSRQKAKVHMQVEVAGIENKEYNVEILAKIFSPEGKQVAETKIAAPRKSKLETVEVPLNDIYITNPELWSCDSPNLYTAKVYLVLNGTVVDNVSERFGVRKVEFSKEYGLKINGKKVFLKGMANHDDLGAVGVAAYETSIARMMDKIKAFGFNCIRTSHNPYSKSFLDLADEKGILIVDELYDKWGSKVAWAGSKPWNDLWYNNIKEWVKRDRNHPSVIMWSLGNELQFQEARWGFPTGDWGVTTYRLMNVVVKRYDPTRKTTVAMYPARAGGIVKHDPDFKVEKNIIPPELSTVTDVASFNYCWRDYKRYLQKDPNLIIFQSEAVTNELTAPYFGMDTAKMVGLAYWGAIEYWGESSGWPNKGWNYSFFNQSLEPFAQAYLIKSIFKNTPLVHIGVVDKRAESHVWNDIEVGRKYISSHWNREKGKKYNIFTYTNADEVELLVNGKSFGIKQNPQDLKKRNVIFWENIPYSPGKIVAIARTKGQVVARDELQTTGKAVALKVVPENAAWKADGMDLQYIKVYPIDSKGRKVPTFNGEVTFDVDGPAHLIAVDNGNHASNNLFTGTKIHFHDGFAMAILRSIRKSGTVKVKISVSGLKGVEKKFNTK